jgi:uncharacterized protein DUF4388/transposase
VIVGTDKEAWKFWDDARKSALVAQIVSGKLSVKAACQRHDVSADTIQDWVRVFRRTTLRALDEHLRQTFLIQGADAASLSTAEYTGTLDDIPIADLLQTFQMGAKDGVITISHDGQRSQLWCDKGEIVDAESGRLRGAAAVYRIVNIESGQVLADFRSEPRERTIELPGHVLLLEAARRKDESARLVDRLGESAIYAATQTALAQGTSASAEERELLAACDGEHTLEEIVAHSDLGDLETLTAIASLLDRHYLVRDPTSIAPRSSGSSPVSRDTPGSVVSLSPLATSQRVTRAPRRAPLVFVGVGLGLGSLFWVAVASFSQVARSTAARSSEPTAANARASSRPAPTSSATPGGAPLSADGAAGASPTAPARATSFPLDFSAEPADAELWLDGAKVGVGHVQRQLPLDGVTHALRVIAPGYAPTTLLFMDAPPPRWIKLEKLVLPRSDAARAPAPPSPARAATPAPPAATPAPDAAPAPAAPAAPEAPTAPARTTPAARTPPPPAPTATPVPRRAPPPPRARRPSLAPAPDGLGDPPDKAPEPPPDESKPSAPRIQIIE